VEPDATELILMGSLNDETEINGSDAVRIVKYAVGGDCNLDGSVDVGDLGILASNYQGSDLSWAEGDFNGNAMVDVGDLGVFASNYGTVSPPTIPEPASAILLLLGFSGVLCKRMKKEIAGL